MHNDLNFDGKHKYYVRSVTTIQIKLEIPRFFNKQTKKQSTKNQYRAYSVDSQ